jgi:hypothetical protein
MCLLNYYERQAATSRRLAEQAITAEQARQLLTAANNFEQRAHQLYLESRSETRGREFRQTNVPAAAPGLTSTC